MEFKGLIAKGKESKRERTSKGGTVKGRQRERGKGMGSERKDGKSWTVKGRYATRVKSKKEKCKRW